MKTKILFAIFAAAVLFASSEVTTFAQGDPSIKRTIYKTDRFDFDPGGNVSVIGAPSGSIKIEGWKNREVEITAEIEVQANSEADIKLLTDVTGFMLDESLGRASIISVGTHDKKYLKKVNKKFPKHLLTMPFAVNYVIKVPSYSDLDINGGKGDAEIKGVEGVFRVNFVESNANFDLVGGGITAIIGSGRVDLKVPSTSWRGRFIDLQLAKGDMHIAMPPDMNAEIDATILRTGSIKNNYAGLKPKVRKAEFTDRAILAKSGLGGPVLKFAVTDGTIELGQF